MAKEKFTIPEGVRQHLEEEDIEYFKHLINNHRQGFVGKLLQMTDEDMATAVKLFKEFEEEQNN